MRNNIRLGLERGANLDDVQIRAGKNNFWFKNKHTVDLFFFLPIKIYRGIK